MTTIKVDSLLRDRLNQIARQQGVSASRALEGMVADRERSERFRRLRNDMAAMAARESDGYAAEAAEWDPTLTDG